MGFTWRQTQAGESMPQESISCPLPAAAKAPLGERFPLSPYRLSHRLCFKTSWNARQKNKTLILTFINTPTSFGDFLFQPTPVHLETVANLSSLASLFVLPPPASLGSSLSPYSFPNGLLREHFHHLCVKFGSCESSSHSPFSWLIFSDKICSPFGH